MYHLIYGFKRQIYIKKVKKEREIECYNNVPVITILQMARFLVIVIRFYTKREYFLKYSLFLL
ncbi:hypothetical protein CGC48_04515 [Capnocytophaga cynodegmi]|uniref:Uncharacterized protein n=1 Tax=Capnocytophaga cynodegmi TaxID=28189 RepID=A0A250E8D1_9FLAO|nr:hypothetical protein CGC48_04515 [Capnocytophaga cynodegmi]